MNCFDPRLLENPKGGKFYKDSNACHLDTKEGHHLVYYLYLNGIDIVCDVSCNFKDKQEGLKLNEQEVAYMKLMINKLTDMR